MDELRAIADYRKSIVNFERVQEAGVGGAGAVAILGGQAGGQAGQAIRSSAAAAGSNQFRPPDASAPEERVRSAPLFVSSATLAAFTAC